ncbi:hypothetical protein ACHAWF_012201 [Thalassiosira exigua]
MPSRTTSPLLLLPRLLLLASVAATAPLPARAQGGGVAEEILWSSTGGGWRAMFADVGFANAFRRAGLFPDGSEGVPDSGADDGTENGTDGGTINGATSARIASVATVSGGSWFSTQLFYSDEFYRRTVGAETGEELESFVREWMGSYRDLSSDVVRARASARGVGTHVCVCRVPYCVAPVGEGDWTGWGTCCMYRGLLVLVLAFARSLQRLCLESCLLPAALRSETIMLQNKVTRAVHRPFAFEVKASDQKTSTLSGFLASREIVVVMDILWLFYSVEHCL